MKGRLALATSMQHCLTCYKMTANPRFCSQSCAAKRNNHLFPKRKPTGRCNRCRKPLRLKRGICDICKARMSRWRIENRRLTESWTPWGRNFALDLVGLSLWWAEGDKHYHRVAVTNSDPDVILIVLRWLREVYNVPLRKFHVSVRVHSNIDVRAALRFWSRLTGVPLGQFTKPYVFPFKKGTKRTRRMAWGVCSLRVFDVRLVETLRSRLDEVRSLTRPVESAMLLTRLSQDNPLIRAESTSRHRKIDASLPPRTLSSQAG